MTSPAPLKVGQHIALDDGRSGTIRFVGPTSFKDGEWIGVELDEATGKNDGAVQGERYFACEMGKGLFCQAQKVAEVLREPVPPPPPSSASQQNKDREKGKKVGGGVSSGTPSAVTAGRTSAAGMASTKRQSVVSNGLKRPDLKAKDPVASRRQTLNEASPTPAPRTGSSLAASKASPLKPPARPSTSTPARTVTSPSTVKKAVTKPTTTATTSRPSISAGSARPSSTTSTTAPRTNRTSILGTPSTNKANNGFSRTSTKAPTLAVASKHSPSSSRVANGSVSQSQRDTKQEMAIQENMDGSPDSKEVDAEESDAANKKLEESLEDESKRESIEEDKDEEAQEKIETPTPSARPPRSEVKQSATPGPPNRAAAAIANKREEELQRKLQSLEKRHAEDREQLSALEKIKAERDKFENVIHQLQNKYRPQSQKLTETEKRLKETQDQLVEIEAVQVEHDSAMEIATLDREVAEETAEALREQYDELKTRVEELELELETAQHENEELSKDLSPEERASKGWMNMESENERLRAALIRLRDMTREKEADLNKQISELEDDLQKFDGLQAQYDETRERLQQTETDIVELKEQLEAAGGTEDMMEDLTEKNLALNEHVAELRLEIEQLEDLRDLNDEMELAHVENEKQMQDELDHRDTLLAEHSQLSEQQAGRVAEYEYTVSKFRELVAGLQSHIDDLKASQELTEAETEELTGRSKAIAELNRKLQDSATRTQIRTVDLELGKLEAQEAVEHFNIVKLFLPEAYQAEKDSVHTYLRFKRLGFKANLLCNSFKERFVSIDQYLNADNAFVSCDIIDKLCWIFTTCDRFVNDIQGSSAERFTKYASALYELDSVERSMNSFVEDWKANELKESRMAEQLQRSKLLLAHLAETYIEDSLENYAVELLARSTVIETHLETTSYALSYINTLAGKASDASMTDSEDAAESISESLTDFRKAMDNFVNQCRSGRVITNKTFTALKDLQQRSMTLNLDTRDTFETAEHSVLELPVIARELGEHFRSALDDDSEAYSIEDSIRISLSNLQQSDFLASKDRNALSSFSSKITTCVSSISSLQTLANDLSISTEFQKSSPPWTARSQALANTSLATQSTTEENTRLKESIQQRTTDIRARDEKIEEQTVKIELLETRMRDASTKANKISEMESQIDIGRRREKELMEAIEAQLRNTSTLQAERDRWKAMADEAAAKNVSREQDEEEDVRHEAEDNRPRPVKRKSVQLSASSAFELDALRLEIKDLQGVVRHLRSDNQRVMLSDPTTSPHMAWLSEPLVPPAMTKQKKEERNELSQETSDVFADLMALVKRAQVVDLQNLPENRLVWRPAKEKSSWIVAAKREEWESWRKRRNAAVKKGVQALGPRTIRRPELQSTAQRDTLGKHIAGAANGNLHANGWKPKSSARPQTPETVMTETTDAASAISSMPPSPDSSSKRPTAEPTQIQPDRGNADASRPSSSSPDVPTVRRSQQQQHINTSAIPSSSPDASSAPKDPDAADHASPLQSSRSVSPEEERPFPAPEQTSPTSPTSPTRSRKRRPTVKKRLSIGYRLPMSDEVEEPVEKG